MYIEPSELATSDEDFNAKLLNFTWYIKEYDDTTIDLKLNFSNPVYISSQIKQDKIIVFINDTSWF